MLKPQVTWSKISRKSANQKLACFIPGKSRTRVNPWLVQIKLSQDVSKITMPGQKEAYRLYSSDGRALIDLLTMPEEEPPKVYTRITHKRKIYTEDKAKVVASVWGTEFIHFLAVLAVLHQDDMNKRVNCTRVIYGKGGIHPTLQIVLVENI